MTFSSDCLTSFSLGKYLLKYSLNRLFLVQFKIPFRRSSEVFGISVNKVSPLSKYFPCEELRDGRFGSRCRTHIVDGSSTSQFVRSRPPIQTFVLTLRLPRRLTFPLERTGRSLTWLSGVGSGNITDLIVCGPLVEKAGIIALCAYNESLLKMTMWCERGSRVDTNCISNVLVHTWEIVFKTIRVSITWFENISFDVPSVIIFFSACFSKDCESF